MSQKAAKAQEPSMEEILASIRRIISDENGAEQSAPKPERAPPEPPPASFAPSPKPAVSTPPPAPTPSAPMPKEPDVLELTEMVEMKSEPVFQPVVSPDVEFRDDRRSTRPEPEPLASSMPTFEPQTSASSMPARSTFPTKLDEQLLSQRASEAVSTAFGSLANTMFAGSGRSIEDVVREMLKPMLRSWLEDNLPSLVERLVRAEIERVSRGGR